MPANKTNSLHYGEKVSIDFYPDSHRYRNTKTGEWLISNTACVGILDKSRPFLIKSQKLSGDYFRKYLDDSGRKSFKGEEMISLMEKSLRQWDDYCNEGKEIGTKFHDWAEKFAQAKIAGTAEPEIDESLGVKLVQAISGFLSWYNSNEIKFLEPEKVIYSKKNDFVGITDAIVILNGKKTILDYKTSKSGHYPEYKFQIAGYAGAYIEEYGELDNAFILNFSKETGDFEAIEISMEEMKKNYDIFLALLKVKRRLKELDIYANGNL